MASERDMRGAVCRWFVAQGLTPVFEVHLCHQCDFVGVRFGDRVGIRIPEAMRVVAVELKLSDVKGVLKQCRLNAFRVPEVYAAMPSVRCERMRQATLQRFLNEGVGLLSVGEDVTELIPAATCHATDAERFDSLRKALWRRRNQWPTRLAEWLSRKAERVG